MDTHDFLSAIVKEERLQAKTKKESVFVHVFLEALAPAVLLVVIIAIALSMQVGA